MRTNMQVCKRLGLAAAAAAAAVALVAPAAPAAAINGAAAPAACHTYGPVLDAPKGKIARDDSVTVRRDPLARWVTQHPARARAATAAGGTVTIPVAFHVIRSDNSRRGGSVPDAAV